MSDQPDIRRDLRRVAKWAAAAGAVLALLCPHLPPDYQAPCAAAREVANICTFGGSP